MNWLFRLALVVHVTGILWLISAITLELLGSLLLRGAKSIEAVKSAGSVLKQLPKFFGPASALIIISGLYMSWVRLDHDQSIGWVVVSIVGFLAMAISGSALGKKKSEALKAEVRRSKGTMTDGLQALTRETAGLRQGLGGAGMVLGILVLMIYKPGVIVSVAVLLAAVLLSLAATRWLTARLPQ